MTSSMPLEMSKKRKKKLFIIIILIIKKWPCIITASEKILF